MEGRRAGREGQRRPQGKRGVGGTEKAPHLRPARGWRPRGGPRARDPRARPSLRAGSGFLAGTARPVLPVGAKQTQALRRASRRGRGRGKRPERPPGRPEDAAASSPVAGLLFSGPALGQPPGESLRDEDATARRNALPALVARSAQRPGAGQSLTPCRLPSRTGLCE